MRACVISLLLCAALVPPAFGQAPDANKTRAAALLCLQASARARECHVCAGGTPCAQVVAKGRALASVRQAQLFIWVGTINPQVRAAFPKAIHVEVGRYNGTRDHRLVLPMPDHEYRFAPGDQGVGRVKAFLDSYQKTSAKRTCPCDGVTPCICPPGTCPKCPAPQKTLQSMQYYRPAQSCST